MLKFKEYLEMFSNSGDIKVHVEFKKFGGSIAPRFMQSKEILALVSDNKFISEIMFDGHPFRVIEYKIKPSIKALVIVAEPVNGDAIC
ncbi:hypothetical protein [Alteromonas facilis]|uniref:hypothetical protein n=1 Tax=Alteromonas facilis TaxID=2048004 RepID=UPI000C282366|nr:hypothetical protein [Alteromonas facilis]